MNSDLFFERLSNHYANNFPFVAYSKPHNSNIFSFLQTDHTVHYLDDFSSQGFVFAPFKSDEKSILMPTQRSEFMVSEFNDHAALSKKEFDGSYELAQYETHIKLIKKGIEHINKGEMDKVVLSRCESIPIQNANPMALFQELLRYYPDAFVYCWSHPKVGLWLGATPETLLSIKGSQFRTMALAGTQTYKGSLDVTWQDKDINEQKFVTDFLIANLKDDIDHLKVTEANTVKAGNLLHLKTELSGQLRSDLKTVLDKIHPTPAVCGTPRDAAKMFILENETYRREFYSGYLGELNLKKETNRNRNRKNVENSAYNIVKNTTDLFVNLRCMKIEGSQGKIYVGGGITRESDAEKEWIESVNKSKTMKQVIAF